MDYGAKKYQRIRNLREDKDITQKTIAAFLNISQNTYSQYETNVLEISIGTMAKLADFHNTSIDYLVERTDEPSPYPHKQNL